MMVAMTQGIQKWVPGLPKRGPVRDMGCVALARSLFKHRIAKLLVALGFAAMGCAVRVPMGCDEAAFARQAAQCVANIRLAAPTDRQEVADACIEAINVHEDACHGVVPMAPAKAAK
jgi:hypothetical protein